MTGTIDIHTHITPNVDDGSTGMEMSLEMLRLETAQGCTHVFLTPHSDAFEWGGPENMRRVCDRMKRVRAEAAREELPLQILEGCEIYTSPAYIEGILQDLKSGRLLSMNGTRYVMAEFKTHQGSINDAKYCLRRYLEEGWIPIIAHAERYCRTFATVENISILKEMGCLVQINYYDLAQEHDDEIRRCAQALVEAELADMTGSDCHRMNHRSPALKEGIRYIREHCRAEYAEDLLWRNAQMLLCDRAGEKSFDHSPGL